MFRQVTNSGEIIDWEVKVINDGSHECKVAYADVIITGDLEPYIKVVSAPEVSKGFYNTNNNRWNIGDLLPNSEESIKLQIEVSDISVFDNYQTIDVYFRVDSLCDNNELDNDVCLTIAPITECDSVNIHIGPK